MAGGNLAKRFFWGNNNHSIYLTTHAQHDFFYGIPQRQKQMVSLAKAQLAAQMETARAIAQSNSYVAQEINQLNRSMEASISHLGEDIVYAIDQLEYSLVCEFREVKWILAQYGELHAKLLQEIVQILKNQRSAQANELVRQATKNLVSGFYEEAKDRLLEALTWDNTDFQVHRNLGFVYLNADDGDKAIEHFYKAKSFAPNKRAEFDACGDLARSYYAIGKFDDAAKYASELIKMTEQTPDIASTEEIARCWYTLGVYNGLFHQSALCISGLKNSILLRPHYFALAAIDRDLDVEKKNVNGLLANLAEDASNKASASYHSFVKRRSSILSSQVDMVQQTINAVDRHARIAERTLRNASYSDLLDINENCKIMKEIVYFAQEEVRCRSEINSMSPDLSRNKARLDDLYDREAKRRAFLAGIDKIKTGNKKFLASLGYIAFVLLCFVGTAIALGAITFYSAGKMSDTLGFGRPANDHSLGAIAEILLGMVWALANLGLLVATAVAPFAVARGLLSNMGNYVKKISESAKIYHDESRPLQQQRSVVSEKESKLNQLQNRVHELSARTEGLLKRIVWRAALE